MVAVSSQVEMSARMFEVLEPVVEVPYLQLKLKCSLEWSVQE